MCRLRKLTSLAVFVLGIVVVCHSAWAGRTDDLLINWLKANTSKDTGLPLSFQLPADPVERQKIWDAMGPYTTRAANANSVDGIIERVIVNEGLDIYDGACWQIALSSTGTVENLALARVPIKVYWDGYPDYLGDLQTIRAGWDDFNPGQRFIYDEKNKYAVGASVWRDEGRRGFIFRIFDANGKYGTSDPLDGKGTFAGFPVWPVIHLEDWKPIAGENAWVVMAALQHYHAKYYDKLSNSYKVPQADLISYLVDSTRKEAIELALSQELARCALLLQADNGGIRMSPIGTWHPAGTNWYYNEISTENNLSWYAAFRMFYAITGDAQYKSAMEGIERYLKSAWDAQNNVFYQGMHYANGNWQLNSASFAVDCQTWPICVLGPQKIDSWFGEGAAYKIWQKTKERSSYSDNKGTFSGVGYTTEHDRMSIEWTAGAVLACKILSDYYKTNHADWSVQAAGDAQSMRAGMETFKHQVSADQAGYSYSSKRGAIPFGWNSHDPAVLSTTSTAWVYFLDIEFNPFVLGGKTAFIPAPPAVTLSISLEPGTRYPVLTITRNDPRVTKVRIYYSDGLPNNWSPLSIVLPLTGDTTIFVDDGTATKGLSAQRYYRLSYNLSMQGALILKSPFPSPAIVDLNNDGGLDILVGSDGKNLVALDKYGNISWKSAAEITDVVTSPVIAKDNKSGGLRIAVLSSDGVCSFDQKGQLLWKYQVPINFVSSLAPILSMADINGDGALETLIGGSFNMFRTDNALYCLIDTPGWQEFWKKDTYLPLSAQPVVVDIKGDGSRAVIVGTSGFRDERIPPRVFCLDANSREIWSYLNPGGVLQISAADINADGQEEVLFTSLDNYLYCLDHNGKLFWRYLTGGFAGSATPVVGDLNADGKLEVVVGSVDGKVYCLNSQGALLWSYFTGAIGRDLLNVSAVLADINKDGSLEVLIPSMLGEVYCLNKDGALLWKYTPVSTVTIKGLALADLDGDGNRQVLFVATYQAPKNYSELVCLNNQGEIFTPAKTQGAIDPLAWPMFQRDLQHTGLYDLTPPVTPRVQVAQSTYATSQLYASFVSQDKESGVLEYRYRITAGSKFGPLIRNWTSVRGAAYVTAGALRLTKGRTYYFTVQAKNNLGLWSQSGYSDGITFNAVPPRRYPKLRN